MGINNWKIIFKGRILAGFDIAVVKKSLQKRFNLSTVQVEQIFSGSTVIMKRVNTEEKARNYFNQLQAMGLEVYLEQETLAANDMKNKAEDFKTGLPVGSHAQYNEQPSYHPQEPINSPAIFNFDFSGRYGRLNYINASLIVSLLFYISLLLWFIPISGIFIAFITFIAFGLFIVFTVRFTILRLHDADIIGWWALLALIPVVNYIFHLFLLIFPGTAHTNKYGPAVKRGSFAGLILSLVAIPMLGILAAIILPAYQDYVYKKRVVAVYQEMLIFSHKVDVALYTGMMPILGSVEPEDDNYVPLAMAYGDVMESSSSYPTINDIESVGLNVAGGIGDGNVEIYAVFDGNIARMSGATMSLQRDNTGKWDCIVYATPSVNLKPRFIPKACKIAS